MVKSPDSPAAKRLAVSGWIGLKAATWQSAAVTGWHSASSSAGGPPVSGTPASAVRRRPLAATSAERQKLATPLVIGHHRGGWSVPPSGERSTLNSRGLLMVVSTRNTVA